MNTKKQKLVPALEHAIDILEYLALSDLPETVKNLSETLEIPQASCFRLVNTLIDRGYLQKTESGQARLGPRNALLHRAFLTRNEILRVAQPYTQELLGLTDMTVELTVYVGDEITFLEILDSPRPITVKFNRKIGIPLIGSSNPITLIILAHLPNDNRKKLLERMYRVREILLHLEPWLQQFPFTPELDSAELDLIRETGIATDFGIQTPEVTRIAAPFFDVNGDILGTIGVAVPLFYLPPDRSDTAITAVKTIAEKLSVQFGYHKDNHEENTT